jgi:hypothetical protein
MSKMSLYKVKKKYLNKQKHTNDFLKRVEIINKCQSSSFQKEKTENIQTSSQHTFFSQK